MNTYLLLSSTRNSSRILQKYLCLCTGTLYRDKYLEMYSTYLEWLQISLSLGIRMLISLTLFLFQENKTCSSQPSSFWLVSSPLSQRACTTTIPMRWTYKTSTSPWSTHPCTREVRERRGACCFLRKNLSLVRITILSFIVSFSVTKLQYIVLLHTYNILF